MRNVLVTLASVRQRGEWAGGGKVVFLLLRERSRGGRELQEPGSRAEHRLYEQTHAGQTAPACHHPQLALISLPVQNSHPGDLPEQSSH